MIYFILVLMIAFIGFGVKIFVLEGKKKNLPTYIEELQKLFQPRGIQNNHNQNKSPETNTSNLHKEDFGTLEIKSKKLYQYTQKMLSSLKGGDTQTIVTELRKYIVTNRNILGDNIFMISQELIDMIEEYKTLNTTPEVKKQGYY